MDETLLLPSPNWFQVSGLAVTNDGWLIYGGPSKSLCVLEPLPADSKRLLRGCQTYATHVRNRAHPEKITSVAVSPEWPDKKALLAGSADGSVKQWSLEQIHKSFRLNSTHSHDVHHHAKEEVAGVSYLSETFAVTVGCYGNIVKWDFNSNVVKKYNNLKGFKPTCMACSQHLPQLVAIGTKQGVVFVLDITSVGRVVYKVRGQDDEITNLSWCPQYNVFVKKSLKDFEPKNSITEKETSVSGRMDRIRQIVDEDIKESLEKSGVCKNLPEDSFDESVVQEDDMFDIYKDHEADEFGHKKYQPEEIIVKIKEECEPTDYLVECEKLKEEILLRKNKQEESMESLVNALDNAHLNAKRDEHSSISEAQGVKEIIQSGLDSDNTQSIKGMCDNTHSVKDTSDNMQCDTDTCSNVQSAKETCDDNQSLHTHRHLLATIGKYGSVRIWSKTGKLVGTCAVPSSCGKNTKVKFPNWPTLLWYKSDVLLIGDGKSQLLECNPLKIDSKNKLEWRVVHSLHKRGLYCIATAAPRIQTEDMSYDGYNVWTTSQERNLICYSMSSRQVVATYNSCGGYLYKIQSCPYDAGKIAVSVGDGAVRVWETEICEENDCNLKVGQVTSYWQNVQGKVLTVAWHPTKENLLAFGTAESRIGLIDTSGKSEKPARVLVTAVNGGVYSLCWGDDDDLYACGGGNLVVYKANKVDDTPSPIKVEWEGQKWEVSSVLWRQDVMLCSSNNGAIAAVAPEPPYNVLTATFVFSKTIYTMDWHPQQTSNSTKESVYKNLIAVCSIDKQNTIVILEYSEREDGTKQFSTWKTLSGHKGTVMQITWNPHQDGMLLSTSQDFTVMVWNVAEGVCTNIYRMGAGSAVSAIWCPYPQLANIVISGGSDCCLRIWDITDHTAEEYNEALYQAPAKKKRKDKKEAKKKDDEVKKDDEGIEEIETDENVAAASDAKAKVSKKFLLPHLTKQMSPCSANGLRKLFHKHLEKNGGSVSNGCEEKHDADYIKIFGTTNEVNEVLDEELERHQDTGNDEAWIMLSIFRGHIDAVVKYANQRDLLCPYLLSITPCVSLKYWKDTSQLYLAQIDRLIAKKEEGKLCENKSYGGSVYRKAATLLSVHDIKGAVNALTEARLYKEAYILCRTRYMDSIAEETLNLWAKNCYATGNFYTAAVCHVALGDLSQAATILGKSKDEEWLSLAAELAKAAGQTTFADHISGKREQMLNETVASVSESLDELPSRIELLMKETGDTEKNENNKPLIDESGNGDIDKTNEVVMTETDTHEIEVKDKIDIIGITESGDGEMKGYKNGSGDGEMKACGDSNIKDNVIVSEHLIKESGDGEVTVHNEAD